LSGLAGDSYTLDFSTKGQNPSSNSFTVKVIVFYRDRTQDIVSTDLTPNVNWTPSSIVALTNKDYVSVQIQIIANAASSGDAWFDSFHLRLN
jgi:hypothetical protein